MTDRATFIETEKESLLERRLKLLFIQKRRWGFEGWIGLQRHETACERFLDVSAPTDSLSRPKTRRAPLETPQNGFAPRLLTVDQAAVYLGRTKTAVQCMIADRALPVVRHDRRVFLDVKDLDAWIDKGKD